MMATVLEEVLDLHSTSAEEMLRVTRITEEELDLSYRSGGFSGELTVYGQELCVLALDIPDSIDLRTMRSIVNMVTTDEVRCATVICGKKIVLELNELKVEPDVDPEVYVRAAAGSWFETLLDYLQDLGKKSRRKLRKLDELEQSVLKQVRQDIIAVSARPSGDSFDYRKRSR